MRDLLEDYFYRSDHVDVQWEHGKDKIGKHSVAKEMDPEDWYVRAGSGVVGISNTVIYVLSPAFAPALGSL